MQARDWDQGGAGFELEVGAGGGDQEAGTGPPAEGGEDWDPVGVEAGDGAGIPGAWPDPERVGPSADLTACDEARRDGRADGRLEEFTAGCATWAEFQSLSNAAWAGEQQRSGCHGHGHRPLAVLGPRRPKRASGESQVVGRRAWRGAPDEIQAPLPRSDAVLDLGGPGPQGAGSDTVGPSGLLTGSQAEREAQPGRPPPRSTATAPLTASSPFPQLLRGRWAGAAAH